MKAPRNLTRSAAILGGLTLALTIACVAGAVHGALDSQPLDAFRVLAFHLHLTDSAPADPLIDSVLWEIRFPRVALAAVVGASLGCAGATMQGTFANPLAEPGIVGVSSGAVLGAVVQIVLGIDILGRWSLPSAAFLGGLIAVMAVYVAARHEGRTEVVTLVLTGVALNALLGAIIGGLTYFSDDEDLRSITFWTLGSVANASWRQVVVVAPLALTGVTISVALAKKLDLLSLGERSAQHLGLSVERFRLVMLAVTAVLTAAAVAVAGIVLFVGLVIPHLVRIVSGPSHRMVIPAAALAGALILVVSDLIARTAAAPSEIPLGVLTSLVGSPVFFWLLIRTRARQGGWG